MTPDYAADLRSFPSGYHTLTQNSKKMPEGKQFGVLNYYFYPKVGYYFSIYTFLYFD